MICLTEKIYKYLPGVNGTFINKPINKKQVSGVMKQLRQNLKFNNRSGKITMKPISPQAAYNLRKSTK